MSESELHPTIDRTALGIGDGFVTRHCVEPYVDGLIERVGETRTASGHDDARGHVDDAGRIIRVRTIRPAR